MKKTERNKKNRSNFHLFCLFSFCWSSSNLKKKNNEEDIKSLATTQQSDSNETIFVYLHLSLSRSLSFSDCLCLLFMYNGQVELCCCHFKLLLNIPSTNISHDSHSLFFVILLWLYLSQLGWHVHFSGIESPAYCHNNKGGPKKTPTATKTSNVWELCRNIVVWT